MPDPGDVVYTITDIRVARWLPGNTYDTTSFSLTYGSEMSFEVDADNDELMSYGMAVSALSIIKKLTGTLKQAAIDSNGIYVLTGHSTTTSGSTPNRTITTDMLAGGSGLPFFGAVGNFASEDGANVLLGLRKCKLDTLPGWTVEMNKFRLSEVKFKAFTPDVTTRKLHRIRRYETAAAIPVDLNTFFA
jgi:hypothetical protein